MINNDNNILIYLTNENGITCLEEEVQNAKQFLPKDYRTLLYLIRELKMKNAKDLFLESSKVKNESGKDDPGYMKRRIEKDNQRLIYIRLNNKVLKTEKPTFLVITGGNKTETKQASVYKAANSNKDRAINFRKIFESSNMTDSEIENFLKKQKEIEKQLLDNIKPKSMSTGGKTNGK